MKLFCYICCLLIVLLQPRQAVFWARFLRTFTTYYSANTSTPHRSTVCARNSKRERDLFTRGGWQRQLIMVNFLHMNEITLREWVEANLSRVNDEDDQGYTPLYLAVYPGNDLSLVLWLLDEKGADVKAAPIHMARSSQMRIALLDRGADPNVLDREGRTLLIHRAIWLDDKSVARLLEDPCVRAVVNMRDE